MIAITTSNSIRVKPRLVPDLIWNLLGAERDERRSRETTVEMTIAEDRPLKPVPETERRSSWK